MTLDADSFEQHVDELRGYATTDRVNVSAAFTVAVPADADDHTQERFAEAVATDRFVAHFGFRPGIRAETIAAKRADAHMGSPDRAEWRVSIMDQKSGIRSPDAE